MSKVIREVNLIKYTQVIITAFMTAMLFFAAPVSAAEVTNDAVKTSNNPPLPKPVGRVVWVKGELKAIMANLEERILQKTSVVYEKDTLITDPKSEAQVVFTDNTLITFKQGTKFVVDQYSYHPIGQKGSVGKYVVNLLEGGFRTITGLIAKRDPSDYQVNTPVATIGVRGTDYAVVLTHGQLYIGYYSGSPCVTNKGLDKKELCLSQQTPYAQVQGVNYAPVPINEQPIEFRQKLEIIPTKITPFSAAPGTVQQVPYSPKANGPISSFCITQ